MNQTGKPIGSSAPVQRVRSCNGREQERKKIVAWLRAKAKKSKRFTWYHVDLGLSNMADELEKLK
jgi:hypothetical protein